MSAEENPTEGTVDPSPESLDVSPPEVLTGPDAAVGAPNPERLPLADFMFRVLTPALATLSEAGLASFGNTFTQEAYLNAFSELGAECEEAIMAAFPPGKAHTQLGTQAAVLKLSRRLGQLAELHFSKFIGTIDGFCERNLAAGSDASISEKWRRAVINVYASKLWHDVQNAWAGWLDHVREVTKGASFGVRVRVADDREYLTLASHEQRMRETLETIAKRYSLSDEAVRKLRTPRIALQIDPDRPETPRELSGSDPIPSHWKSQPELDEDVGDPVARTAKAAAVTGSEVMEQQHGEDTEDPTTNTRFDDASNGVDVTERLNTGQPRATAGQVESLKAQPLADGAADPGAHKRDGDPYGGVSGLELARMRRETRRYKARRAALDLVIAPRIAADADLLRESANAVQQSWPRDSYHLEQVLWPSFSNYSTVLFDRIAEARLGEMESGFLVRRYVHWLQCTCVWAVVEDLCNGGRIWEIAKHIFDVIGEVRWPEQAPETRRALARMMTEVLGGPHTENLEKRLRPLLNARAGHWEAEAIEKKSRNKPAFKRADQHTGSEVEAELEARRALERKPDDEVRRREGLLAEYKKATGDPSNRRIYGAKNSGLHKPQFYEWLRGELPPTSETTINFERFLVEKKPPVPRTPRR